MKIKEDLNREAYSELAGASPSNPITVIKALDIACKIIDNRFGQGVAKNNPDLALRLCESFLSGLRNHEHISSINRLSEYIDSSRISLSEAIKGTFSGVLTIDIPGVININGTA